MSKINRNDIDIVKMIVADKIKSLEMRLDRKYYKDANDTAYREDLLNEIVITRNVYEKLKSLHKDWTLE